MDYVAELMNEVEERVKARGLSGEDLLQALAFKQKALKMIANGAGLNNEAWARFQAFLAPYRDEPWFSYVSEPKERGPAQKKLYLMTRSDRRSTGAKSRSPCWLCTEART